MQTKKILFSLEVTVVFLSLTVYLWHTIEATERQKRHQAIEIGANQLKGGIEAFVNEKVSILMQVRNFWLNSKSIDHDEFLGFCRSIIGQIPGFQAIEFGDTSDRVVWVEPLSVEDFDVKSRTSRHQALLRAIQKKTVTVTPVLNFTQGGKGFGVIVPIFRTGKYEGAVIGIFKLETLFSLVFDSVLRQQYNIAVFDDEALVFGDEPEGDAWRRASSHVKETMTVGDQNWSLVLWQKEPDGDISFLGSSVLVLGFALSLVLGSLVWVLSTKAEQADVYAALLEVSHQLSASPNMNSVFRVTGETCLRMTGVDRCGIFLWNEAERQFIPAWLSSDRPEDVQQFLGLKLKYGDMALINKIVDEKRSVLVQPEKMGLINPSLVRLFKIRSVLVVPLVSKGNLIGAMSAHVLTALTGRVGIDPAEIDDVIWGCVSQAGEQAGNIARTAALAAGWPETVPGTTVNRACGSSQQALSFAAASVIAGHDDFVVAGGVESMSRVPMGSAAKDGELGHAAERAGALRRRGLQPGHSAPR